MKEERLICPTTPKLSTVTERCLKPKLQIYTAPRNGTYILLWLVPPCYELSTLAKALNVRQMVRLWRVCGFGNRFTPCPMS